ncbi:MAG: hypothetical protein LBI33_13375 [Propionibacteriaceae bacterium]|nr:hypothetical protein [Propionibacteriaceae bacterium]
MKELRILWLYPDILNLHGDRGNLLALTRLAEVAGVRADVTRVTRLTDPVPLAEADFVLVGPGELVAMPAVIAALERSGADFGAYVDAGGVMLVTGTSAALVARETRRQDATTFAGLGLVAADVVERATVYGDDLILRVRRTTAGPAGPAGRDTADSGHELGGFQIRMADLVLEESQAPFADVLYGLGNRTSAGTGTDTEGARRGNLIVTNLLGPALAKNPWYAWDFVQSALTRKYGEPMAHPAADWTLERQGAAAIRRFNATKATVPGVVNRLGAA